MTAPAWPTPKSRLTSGHRGRLSAPRAHRFARRGVIVQRILTDNRSAYRSRLLAALCRARRFKRPYAPCTNGKAERFSPTLLREWASPSRTSPRPTAPPPWNAGSLL
jgi:transposase InsO family protein